LNINLVVNGVGQTWEINPRETLLDLLRRKGYKGVKEGCRAGTCGACVVLRNGYPVNACIVLAAQADGDQITTIEALGSVHSPHALQKAFAQAGAIQCGYCMPGMLLSAHALRTQTAHASLDEFKDALDGHLCRCTGYVKALEALSAIAGLDRFERVCDSSAKQTREDVEQFRVVGKSEEKIDSISLATGSAEFTDDIALPGLLEAKILSSPYAHARIKHIDASRARALTGVRAVLTYENVPRIPYTTAGQGYPEPSPYDTFLLDRKVRFVGDSVAAVAAETEEIAEEALRLINVDYEVLEPVLDPLRALEEGAPVIHDEPEAHAVIPVAYEPSRNIAGTVEMHIGNVDEGFSRSDVVIENEYRTHYGAHCSIEPHVTITHFDERGRLVIRTSTQVPFHIRRIVARVLELPVKMVRVIKPRIGGGFGGKQEVLLEPICAALALATRQPVRLKYSRQGEFVATRTRHPQILRLKSGVNRSGDITALDLNVLMNTGAYGAHALTVLCNTGSKTLPLYHAPNVRFTGKSVYTNLPVGGAYRGYGATQGYFALGIQMDEMAEAIGMDPLEFHRRNHIRAGEGSPVFQALGEGKAGVEMKIESCALDECIERGAREIGWHEKRRKPGDGHLKRGVGMACMMQGSSIPEIDMAGATLKLNDDGSLNLLVGATDLGTGSDTILAQIAAEVLGVETADIIVYSSDTDVTPFDSGAYASSTTYLSGNAVKAAAEDARRQILSVAAELLEAAPEELELKGRAACLRGTERSVSLAEVAHYSLYEKNQFQIIGMDSRTSHRSPPPFAAHFAEIEVDTETGFIRVVKYVAAVDCGTPINPRLAEGQTEGAILNGISFALTEQFLFDNKGRMLNPNFNYYKIFTTRDVPDIKVILIPTYEPSGPFGAKSVSEVSINGPLPAIANAIYDAVGVRLRESPFIPERVLKALRAKRAAHEQ
jgi:putative selenate reductase molybdopterin-binding subunit